MDDFYDQNMHDWLDSHGDTAPKGLPLELEKAIRSAETLRVPAKRTKADAWATLKARIEGVDEDAATTVVPASKGAAKTFRLWPLAAVAASVTFMLVFFWKKDGSTVDPTTAMVSFVVPNGELESVSLPDASQVTINAGSVLEYSKEDWDESRKVKLKGEAFFRVAKGETFTVETSTGSVTVLGTEFNVYARENGFRVACQEGRVRVNVPNSEAIEITAGQGVELIDGKLSLDETLDPGQEMAWQRGEFYFYEADYTEVWYELERQFGVTIFSEIDESKKFTGSFTNGDLTTALEMVTLTNLLQVEKIGSDSLRIHE